MRGCLYITDSTGRIRKYNPDGTLAFRWPAENKEGAEEFSNGPITVDETGNVYVSLMSGNTVMKVSPKGTPLKKYRVALPLAEDRFIQLGGVATDTSGDIYAVDSVDADWTFMGIPSIKRFDLDGRLLTTWDVSRLAEGKVKWPVRVAADGLGALYVSDQSSHCIHKLDAEGIKVSSSPHAGNRKVEDGAALVRGRESSAFLHTLDGTLPWLLPMYGENEVLGLYANQ
jgi:sugar lactone lactonase YvrE